MVEVLSIYNTPLWVHMLPDAEFETNGYYYEVYRDKNGDTDPIDFGNTYDKNYENSLEYACEIAERVEYKL